MDKSKEILINLFKRKSFPENQKNSVDAILSGRKVILYGAGSGFYTFLLFVIKKYNIKASVVLDQKFTPGDSLLGIPAFPPSNYELSGEEKKNAIVVITVGKKEYHKEIVANLRNLGFKNVILSTDIYEYHLPQVPDELGKRGFNYYLDNKHNILSAIELFPDFLSREVFVRYVQTHMQREVIKIKNNPIEEQYFPKDINLSKGYSRVINCGAYNGDTVKRLNALFGKVDAITCFEPDPDNFELLTQYLCAKHIEIAQSVIAFPCGVFSHEMQLRFADGNMTNSMISDKGESFIQCVALDHVIPCFKPTFIQMDVEGVELEALKGAEMLIKENNPDLAICVYHTPNHIWEIPLYIKSLCPGYKFYLRNYTSFISETVLYATI